MSGNTQVTNISFNIISEVSMYNVSSCTVYILLLVCFRMPILYNNITGGRFLCVVFFLCVALAGLSSVVSLMERPIHVLSDFGSKCVYIRHVNC